MPGNGNGNNSSSSTAMDSNSLANGVPPSDASFSPKEMRKFDKKRWKNWGWKYSPGKTSSIEEEDVVSVTATASATPSAKNSRHSSPTSSPKHKKADKESISASTVVSQLLNQSPLRRRPQSATAAAMNATAATMPGGKQANGGKQSANAANQSAANNANRNEIRSSAGARLCQQFDNPDDDMMNDEFQALIINGRPASVHIVPMSSTQFQ